MRSAAVFLTLILVAPLASAAILARPTAPTTLAPVALGLPGPRDGDVLLMLAHEKGLDPARLPVPVPRAGDSIASLVTRLALRTDTGTPVGDLAAFGALDPRIEAPVLTLLIAMEQAWIIRDAAFPVDPSMPDAVPPLTPEQEEALVTSAILVLDTLDSAVIPQLQALADLPVWPTIPIADPVGILRIGSAGNDIDTLPRIVSIDGKGDDTYNNNIAFASPPDFVPTTLESPVGVAIDVSGDDTYLQRSELFGTVGASFLGAGIFYDLNGDDLYDCSDCAGYAAAGVGFFRDVKGNDAYDVGSWTLGIASYGIAIAREDEGNDIYEPSTGMGFAENGGLALFWDRAGADQYLARFSNSAALGSARDASHGWFVDEGSENDVYWEQLHNGSFGLGRCDSCKWSSGSNNPENFGGRGNDGYGLAYLFAHQDTH